MDRSKSSKKGRKSVVVGSFRKSHFNQPISDEETQSKRSRAGSVEMVQDYKSVKSNYKSKSVADFDAASTGSNLLAKRRSSRRPATAIQKEFDKIRQQYAQNALNFEGITYTDDNYRMSWLEMAKSFIFDRQNKRVNQFLKTITRTKMQSELELKRKIERRIYAAKDYKLFNIFGKDLARRLKTYVGAALDSYQQEEDPEENNDHKGKTVSFGVSFSKVSQKEKNAKQQQQQIWQNDDPEFFLRSKTLQRNHMEAAKKLPLLNYSSRDEQKQLIHFVLSYYDILASENERSILQQLLNSDLINQQNQRDFLKDKQRQKKMRLVQLASPKRTLSKKFQNLGMAHGGSTKTLEQNATSWVVIQKSTISMLQTSIGDLKQANKNQNDEWARMKNRLSQTRQTSKIADRVKLKFSRDSPTKIISARLPRAPSAVPAIDLNPAESLFEKFEMASDETPKAKKQQNAPIKVQRLLNKATSMPQLKRQKSVDLIKQPQNGPYQKKLVAYMEKRQNKIGITTPLEQEIFKIDQILEGSSQEQPGVVHSAFTFAENSSQLPQSKTIPVKKLGDYKVSKAVMMYLQKQPVLKQPYRK